MDSEHTYRNLFDVFVCHGQVPALQWSKSKTPGDHAVVTFEDLEYVSEYVADRILERTEGLEKGFIALKVDNCPEWIPTYWGILMAGFKPFLLDARHPLSLTEFFIKQTNAAALITDTLAGFESLNEITKVINVNDLIKCDKKQILEIAANKNAGGRFSGKNEGMSASERLKLYDFGDETALCTSGTTSTAKIFTYNGEAIAAQMVSATYPITHNTLISDDRPKRNLAFLPLHHIFGFMACYIWYSFFAGCLVFPENKAPSSLLAACREHKVTHIMAVPILVNNIITGVNRKLAKEKKIKQIGFKFLTGLSILAQKIAPVKGINFAKKLFAKSVLNNLAGTSIEIIIVGGGHLLPKTMKAINALGYCTICGFGMTETGICSMEVSKRFGKRMKCCVGLPVPTVEYRIVPFGNDPKVGELQIKGESIHSGRIIDGKAMPKDVDAEGWFATGDIGRLTDSGLYIEGRLKEVIVNESGENVYPDDVEDSFTLMDGVNQFAVLGTAKKNSKYEDITLVIETSKELTDKEYLDALLSDIKSRNSQLFAFKRVTKVLVTNDKLPLSNGIKIKRAVLKKQIDAGEGNYLKLMG